jgi:hypothetical protein
VLTPNLQTALDDGRKSSASLKIKNGAIMKDAKISVVNDATGANAKSAGTEQRQGQRYGPGLSF